MAVKLAEKVYLIDTHALGMREVVGAYLIADDKKALIDVGYASSLGKLLEGVKDAGVSVSEIDYIILTHIHLDHAGAVGQLARLAEHSVVKAHPRAVKHLIDPSRLISSVREVYGGEAEKFGEFIAVDQDRVEEAGDGEEIELGELTLRFLHTPGHAPHHLSIHLIETDSVFCGDAVSMKIPSFPHDVPQTPPPSYVHELAVQSIKKIQELDPRAVMRPHYGAMKLYDGWFDEQIDLLDWWKNLVRELSFEGVLKGYMARLGVEELPHYIKQNLRISFDGMMIYLRKTGNVYRRK